MLRVSYLFLSKQGASAAVQAIHVTEITSAVRFVDQRSWLLPPPSTAPAFRYLLPPRPCPLEASRRAVKNDETRPRLPRALRHGRRPLPVSSSPSSPSPVRPSPPFRLSLAEPKAPAHLYADFLAGGCAGIRLWAPWFDAPPPPPGHKGVSSRVFRAPEGEIRRERSDPAACFDLQVRWA